MRIALAQINPTVADIQGNLKQITAACARAKQQRARLLVLPELAICGYPPHDLLRQQGFVEACETAVQKLAAAEALGEFAILIGHPSVRVGTGAGKPVQNTASLLDGGKVVGSVNKRLLPTYDVFDEARHFEPYRGKVKPLWIGNTKLGVHICEDAWNDSTFWQIRDYEADPVAELAQAGAEVLINLSASPWCIGREAVREKMFSHACKRHRLPGLMVNQFGANDHLIFDGHSLAVDREGGRVERFAGFAEDLAVFEWDERNGGINVVGKRPQPKEYGDLAKLASALELGVRDYLAKTGFKQVHIGVSGGIDSALVAVIAARAIGPENVFCVGMPGPHSSEGSVTDAKALCESLKVSFEVIPISDSYDVVMKALDPRFAGTPFGIAEENTQSRLRGLVLMALSNKFGSLVLACGNKSELAVGYSTLYGDMCGALEVIGDLNKNQVYALARHYNRVAESPIPQTILDKAPSAELRPDQKDSDTLPEYDELDLILAAYIEEALGFEQLVERFGDEKLVRRVLKMVDQAEYKRRQAPPVLRVSSRAFGPGRQMPIVQRPNHG